MIRPVASSLVVLCVLSGAAFAQPPAGGLRVVRLLTDGATDPVGLDDRGPRLSWQLAGEARGLRQKAYRVVVASTREQARAERPDVWDSGRVESADPWAAFAGTLASRTTYHWTVRVWSDEEAVLSPAASFETAYLDAGEWKGAWIAGPERTDVRTTEAGLADDATIRGAGEFCRPPAWIAKNFASDRYPNDQGECRELRPVPMFRRAFQVTKPVARARLYSSGLAYRALTLNGASVSDRVLDPGFTDYSKTVLYTTDDVTRMVKRGENVLAVELGSGQFDSSTRTWDWGWQDAEWRAIPRLRLDLRITYGDGTEETVATDGAWRVSTGGPTRYDSYYLGETYDARREVAGWDRAAFDDSQWAPARVVEGPAGTPRAQQHQPIREVDVLAPGARTQPSPGVFVYDVGQNLAGWAEIAVTAPAGTAVEVFYSEKLGSDGRASTDGNNLVLGQLQTDVYVAKGTGEERWRPRFTYKGFQYVQLSGPGGRPLPAGATAAVAQVIAVHSDLPRTSSLETAQATLGRVHRNTVWALRNNTHGIVTDTPVYEKNAWTGDAQLTSGTASILFDTERLYRKMFQDMVDAQSDAGELSLLAPSNQNYGYVGKPFFKPTDCCGATPAWDAFWFVIPWESYLRHGDRRALERTYPVMRKYLDEWIPRWTGKDGDAFAHTLTAGLGDWLPPKDVPTVNAIASTAYYARFARIAADAARVLGNAADAARYEALFGRIRADFNARFLGADGVYREKPDQPYAQTAQTLALAFDLVPDAQRAAVAARLADDVVTARGGNAYVGVLGARYVLPVLTATGHADAAFAAATQTDEPSWGYWTDVLGFTSLGEDWTAGTRSRNHHMFGAIVQWLYEDYAGIRPLSPGYGTIEFRPGVSADARGPVAATYESVRGTVAARWQRTDAGFELDVTVPPTATGVVYVPAPGAAAVTEIGGRGTIAAGRAEGVTLRGVEGDRVVYAVAAGSYRFRVAP
ncbi:MAG: family 78 glycoside hydrolase catalytic domain [Vicinamibacteria bacterium]